MVAVMRAWVAMVAVLVACGDEIRIHPDAIIDDGGVDGSDSGDGGMVVEQMIGPSGGTVTAPGLELVIPPGAVTSDQMITITTTNGPAPVGYAGQSAIYHLEPEGLVFTQPVSVTLDLASVAARTRVFWSKLGNPGFDDRGGAITGSAITASNTHFSDVFAGLLPVELVIAPASADFGNVPVGETSSNVAFTVNNFGDDDTGVLAASISGSDAAHFSITQSTCVMLGTDESCTVTARCAPATAGSKSATLTVGDTTNAVTAQLACTPLLVDNIIVSAPTALDFGTFAVGSSTASSNVVITNIGGTSQGPLDTAITGANGGDFAIATDGCDGVTLAAGSSCTIGVTFSPTATGARAAALSVAGSNITQTSLAGVGVAPAQLEVTPETHDFGVTEIATAATRSVTVRNTGGIATGLLALAIDGSAAFSIQSDTCTNVSLASNATCMFVVQYLPTITGNHAGGVTVTGGAGVSDAITVFGQGLSSPGILATPQTLTFGSFLVGVTSPIETFTITNHGTQATGALTSSMAGPDPSDFTIVNDACENTSLAAGSSCTIDVAFSPSARGTRTAGVVVTAIPGGVRTLPMLGTGLAPAQLVVSPTSQDFGSIGAGSASAPTTLTFTNAGDAPTGALGGIVLTGAQTEVTVVTNSCATITLGGGESCDVVVRYTPTVVGAYTGTLSISSAIGGTAEVTLTGTGLTPAGLSITPTPYDFGSRVVGTSSAGSLFTVVNTGGVSTAALATSIGGGSFADFAITSDSCAGVQLATGAFCQVSITFTPTSTGAKAATLDVTGAGDVTASLAGIGLAPARLVVTPSTLAYGNVVVGSSVMFAVQIDNTGGATSGAIATSLQGADPSQFSLGSDGCEGVALAAGATCTFFVSFSPTAFGAMSAEVELAAAPGDTTIVAMSGTGVAAAQIQISPISTDFGSIVVGQASSAVVFTVQNVGGIATGGLARSLVAPDNAQFSIEPASTCSTASLAPNAMCTIVVRFRPTSNGAKSSGLQVSATPGGSLTAGLSGTGLVDAQLSIAPTAHDFGTIVVGETSGPVAFTVTNNGGVTSGVVDGVFLPPDGSQFIVDLALTSCGVALAPGASCVTAVRFVPSSTGMKTSTGSVFATPGGTVQVALTGTAVGSAALVMVPSSHDFGTISVGATSPSTTFTIINVGGSATGSLMGSMLGNDPGEFQVDIGASTCLFVTLAPNASCMAVIRFSPTTTGAKSADASLAADPGGTVTAQLFGSGL
jgi:hypothetical protein